MTDWAAAKAESAGTGKPILILLTGSDWCTWCIKLEKEVFETSTFADFASENLVLMLADFPRKTKLPADVAKQNEALKKQYLADGYPTVWLLDAGGGKLSADLGEFGHDPDAWVAKLKELIAESRQPARS
jgi:protein disulfide-isomerase